MTGAVSVQRPDPWSLRQCAALAIVLIGVKLGLYWVAARQHGGLSSALCQWDCGWYMSIVTYGYDLQPRLESGQANWAFFPLYPLAVRLMRYLLGEPVAAGLAVSVIAFGGFALLSTVYLRETRPRSDRRAWLVFIVVLPYSLYYFLPYTESLHLLLATAALLMLRRRRPLGSAMVLGLFTAVRPTAVLLVPALVIERLRHGLGGFRPGLTVSQRIEVLADVALPIALAPLGVAAFMVLLWHVVGDPLAFRHVQTSWNRPVRDPLPEIWFGLREWDWRRLLDHGKQSGSYGSGFALLGFVLAGWLLWQRRLLEAWLAASTLLVCLSTGLVALPRYLCGNPAFLFALFDLLGCLRPAPLRWLILAMMALVQGVLLQAWFGHAVFLI